MDLRKIIEKKRDSAKYMVEEITYICKNIEKRSPGSTGEKKACEYMAEVLKKDCGCERADVESFKENPGSFYGWLFFTLFLCACCLDNSHCSRSCIGVTSVRTLFQSH